MSMDTADRYRAPALDKGLDIIEMLAAQPEGRTRAEITRMLDRSPSEIYRMLERLVARGYVMRDSGGDRYQLSLKLFALAHAHPPTRRLAAVAQPLLDAFAAETRQSVHLSMPDRGALLVVAQASPLAHYEFRIKIGARLEFVGTGSGMMLMAAQDPVLLAERLAGWGAALPQGDLARISPALDSLRGQGWRIGPSNHLRGLLDISVPVTILDGGADAVVTCPYLPRVDDEDAGRTQELLAALQTLARGIANGESPC